MGRKRSSDHLRFDGIEIAWGRDVVTLRCPFPALRQLCTCGVLYSCPVQSKEDSERAQ